MSEIQTSRTLDTITTEIVTITHQARCTMVSAAIEVGRRLIEAKAMVPYGEWGKYLEEKVDFSRSQANAMMRLCQEYGDGQESIFGGDRTAIEKLSVTSAIRLLSLPEGERETFMEEHQVEDMSTRELEDAIREKKAAIAEAEAAKAERDTATEKLREAESEAEKAAKDLGAAKDVQAALRKQAEESAAALTAAEEKLKKAKEAEKQAKADLKKAKESLEIPEDIMGRIRAEAEQAAAEKAAKEAEDKLAKLEAAKKEAEEKASASAAALEEARKQAALSSPEAAVFKTLFSQVQEDFNRLLGSLAKIKDADLTGKLRAATGKLLESMEERVSAI